MWRGAKSLAFSAAAFLSLAALADEPAKVETVGQRLAQRPMLAVWKQLGSRAPGPRQGLRVAIWSDGTVLFNKELTFGQDLQRGKIAPYRLAQLKKALEDSDLFSLETTGYAVPDAESDCILVALGTKKQVLECAEGLLLSQGKTDYRELKRCWRTLNDLAILACPDQFQPVAEKFEKTPGSWRFEASK